MLVKLKIMKGPNVGKEIKIPGPKCLIGRGEGCHMRAQSDAVSRRHCVIVISENECVVRDLNSRNGTLVNEQRITEETVLLQGDILRVGPLEFEIQIEQKPGKAKRPAVSDLKDVLTRTAESGQGSSVISEMSDINKWLDEGDAVAKAARLADPETRQFKPGDTDATRISSASDTKTSDAKAKAEEARLAAEAAAKQAEEEAKKKKKEPGKLPARPQFSAKNSRDAAADTLKKFFNRR